MASEAGHPSGEGEVAGRGVRGWLDSEGRAEESRRDTQTDTPQATRRATLFSPERHPRHPIFDISATHVPRRVMYASCASDPSNSGEGVMGVSGVPDLLRWEALGRTIPVAKVDPGPVERVIETLELQRRGWTQEWIDRIIAEAAREYERELEAAVAAAQVKGPSWGVRVTLVGLRWTFEVTDEVGGGILEEWMGGSSPTRRRWRKLGA